MDVRISEAGREDLILIYIDGIERFGREQAEAFQNELDRKFRLIAAHPEIGPVWDREREYRKIPHFPYVVFYSILDGYIRIERVIDGRSDYQREG